jgi:hypothetical protein
MEYWINTTLEGHGNTRRIHSGERGLDSKDGGLSRKITPEFQNPNEWGQKKPRKVIIKAAIAAIWPASKLKIPSNETRADRSPSTVTKHRLNHRSAESK